MTSARTRLALLCACASVHAPASVSAEDVAVGGDEPLARAVAGELRAVDVDAVWVVEAEMEGAFADTTIRAVVRCAAEDFLIWIGDGRDQERPTARIPVLADGTQEAVIRVAELVRAALLDPATIASPPDALAVPTPQPTERMARTSDPDARGDPGTSVDIEETATARPVESTREPTDPPPETTVDDETVRDAEPVTTTEPTPLLARSTLEAGADIALVDGDMGPAYAFQIGTTLRLLSHLAIRARLSYQLVGPTLADPDLPEVMAVSHLTRISLATGYYAQLGQTPLFFQLAGGAAAMLVGVDGQSNFPEIQSDNAETWVAWVFVEAGTRVALHDNFGIYLDAAIGLVTPDVKVQLPGGEVLPETLELGSLGLLLAQVSLGVEVSWGY